MVHVIFKRIANNMPTLRIKLLQAGIRDVPEFFVRKTFLTAFYMTILILFIDFMLFSRTDIFQKTLFFIPILFGLFFLYFIKLPDVKMVKREKEINQEIVYAGRFMIIELESGVPVYQTFRHVMANYELIGKYFAELVQDVDLGTPIDEAIKNVIDTTPSRNFRKMLWQMLNSIKTGSDI
ncbi:MAG: type II secretion system F family protein, partial [Candidatus Nanoarchaeia archaeon]